MSAIMTFVMQETKMCFGILSHEMRFCALSFLLVSSLAQDCIVADVAY